MKLIVSPYARYHLQCVDISSNYIFLLSLTSHSSVNEETVDFLRPLRSRWNKKTRSNIYIIRQPQWKTCSLVESSREGKLIILVRASTLTEKSLRARKSSLYNNNFLRHLAGNISRRKFRGGFFSNHPRYRRFREKVLVRNDHDIWESSLHSKTLDEIHEIS